MSDKAAIDLDYNLAKDHVSNYRDRYVNNMIGTIGMLDGARDEFAKFRDLPATASILSGVLDLGWALAQSFLPVLKFARTVEMAERAIRIANRWNQNAPLSATLVVATRDMINVISKTSDAYGTAKSIATDTATALKTIVPEQNTPSELEGADVTSGAVKEVVEAANNVQTLVEATRFYLTVEKYRRMTMKPGAGAMGEPMITAAVRMLPLPDKLSIKDLDGIKRTHLWAMVSDYCKYQAHILDYGRRAEFVGLNDKQLSVIWELFGHRIPRTKYFPANRCPLPVDANMLLGLLGLPVREHQLSEEQIRKMSRKGHGEI
jgi:hypothetical protein